MSLIYGHNIQDISRKLKDGVLDGDLNANGNSIINLAAPTNDYSPISKFYYWYYHKESHCIYKFKALVTNVTNRPTFHHGDYLGSKVLDGDFYSDTQIILYNMIMDSDSSVYDQTVNFELEIFFRDGSLEVKDFKTLKLLDYTNIKINFYDVSNCLFISINEKMRLSTITNNPENILCIILLTTLKKGTQGGQEFICNVGTNRDI